MSLDGCAEMVVLTPRDGLARCFKGSFSPVKAVSRNSQGRASVPMAEFSETENHALRQEDALPCSGSWLRFSEVSFYEYS